ncbi:ATP-binding protein [Streptomyces lavendulae]|uniref:ATP-binding protein n=1 Tax=Streptomyces lavendulae TaxID=1914 RepID=UPI00371729D1
MGTEGWVAQTVPGGRTERWSSSPINPFSGQLEGRVPVLNIDADITESQFEITRTAVPLTPSGCSCGSSLPRSTFMLPGRQYSTPGWARQRSLETISAWGASPECADDVVLVTSELVTNAVRHSESEVIVLTFELLSDSVKVSVRDQGSPSYVPLEPRTRSMDDVSGRGLFLVDSVSVRWGTERIHGGGATVWAAVALAS